jgi:ATP-binding cassette subfamily B (MDR/TAP) protein 1
MPKNKKVETQEKKSSISTDESTSKIELCDVNENKKKKSKEKKAKKQSVSIFKLFQFATTKERFMVIFAIIFSAGSGALQPLSILIYGQFINTLTSSLSETSTLLDKTLPVIHIMVIMATVALTTGYISNCLWVLTGESQTRRIRSLFLHSVLGQDMSWFDAAEDGSLNTRLASDTQLIQDGISEKFGQFVSLFAQFAAGFLVAFLKGTFLITTIAILIKKN